MEFDQGWHSKNITIKIVSFFLLKKPFRLIIVRLIRSARFCVGIRAAFVDVYQLSIHKKRRDQTAKFPEKIPGNNLKVSHQCF
jgi:hypothetical protein